VLEALLQRAGRDRTPATFGRRRGKVDELPRAVPGDSGARHRDLRRRARPSQLRNLEDRVKVKVVDRTAPDPRHLRPARQVQEGKAQVELAQLS
jgi:GTP-binding protein HflX